MKKLNVLLVFALACMLTMNAQDEGGSTLESKKGVPILPEADDMAIGFDAKPFLNYFGNFLNSGATAPTADFTNTNMAIMGKLFLADDAAVRAKIRIGMGSQTQVFLKDTNANTAGDPNPEEKLYEDKQKMSSSNIYIGAGYEMRRGKGRVQGYYGGELGIMLGSSKEKWEYGLSMDSVNATVVTNGAVSGRTTEKKNGSTFGFGLGAFIGVEYFILPKVSLGAEYTWGVMLSRTGEGEETKEYFAKETAKSASRTTYTRTNKSNGKSGNFALDTGNMGGQINVIFHF